MRIRLGDLVHTITKYTGIAWCVKKLTHYIGYKDCGCDERRDNWNIKIDRDGINKI